jgi:hypothetical protein
MQTRDAFKGRDETKGQKASKEKKCLEISSVLLPFCSTKADKSTKIQISCLF